MKYGTSPVKDMYWKTGPHAAIFKRYENLLTAQENFNNLSYISLSTEEEEYRLMDAFIKSLMKEMKENEKVHVKIGVDVTDELRDLYKTYEEAEKHLKQREADALDNLTCYMKRYIEIHTNRVEVTEKLDNLKAKLMPKEECREEEEE